MVLSQKEVKKIGRWFCEDYFDSHRPKRIYRRIIAGVTLALAVQVVQSQTDKADHGDESAASIRAQLVGGWRLVSRQSRRVDGTIENDPGLSKTPLGVLIYDN